MDPLEFLKTFGYAIIPNVLSNSECIELCGILSEMMSAQKKRGIDSITVNMPHLERPEIFLKYISFKPALQLAEKVIGSDCTACTFAGYQSSPAGGKRTHIDSRIPVVGFDNTINLNFMICLDDFTATNGATVVWPQSHRSGIDPRHLREQMEVPGSVPVVAERGSMFVNLAQTWHDVGPNKDGSSRWALGIQYCRWWQKPTYDFTRCGPKIFSMLTDEQKRLFGFTSRPPKNDAENQYTVTKVQDLPKTYSDVMARYRSEEL